MVTSTVGILVCLWKWSNFRKQKNKSKIESNNKPKLPKSCVNEEFQYGPLCSKPVVVARCPERPFASLWAVDTSMGWHGKKRRERGEERRKGRGHYQKPRYMLQGKGEGGGGEKAGDLLSGQWEGSCPFLSFTGMDDEGVTYLFFGGGREGEWKRNSCSIMCLSQMLLVVRATISALAQFHLFESNFFPPFVATFFKSFFF